MEKACTDADAGVRSDIDSLSDPAHYHRLQTYTGNEKGDNSSLLLQKQPRRPSLTSLQIPVGSIESVLSSSAKTDVVFLSSPGSSRGGLPPRSNLARVKSSVRSLLSQRSFKAKNCSPDCEKEVLIVSDIPPSDEPLDKPSTSRSLSLNKVLFPSSTKSSNSLPVTPMANTVAETVQGSQLGSDLDLSKMEVKHHMTRSFSVPVNIKSSSLKRTGSSGLIRVISARQHPAALNDYSIDKASVPEIAIEDATEDIPEEEAVCRICLMELGEGGDSLKMECNCRGDLALAHQECAVKWFSIKGNKTCDVCNQEVQNLPVTLLKIQTPHPTAERLSNTPQQTEVSFHRIWQDVPVLVLVSMLAYFCFLEQLLVSDMGPRALAISLPFACTFGLVASLLASTMVSRDYMWAYACFQFAIVILLAHVFYTIRKLNGVLSVMLSSLSGFAIAMAVNYLLKVFLNWRFRRQIQSINQTLTEQGQGQHNRRQTRATSTTVPSPL